jgi:hypothetical protein
MSCNVLNCRRCHQPIVKTHHGGRVTFFAEAEEGPSGRYRLICACGEPRDWTWTKGAP